MSIEDVISNKTSDPEFAEQVQAAEQAWKEFEKKNPVPKNAPATHCVLNNPRKVKTVRSMDVTIDTKVTIMNELEFKHTYADRKPTQRLIRHHPSLEVPVDLKGTLEKVWVFKWQPTSPFRTLTNSTRVSQEFHEIAMQPQFELYKGQADNYMEARKTEALQAPILSRGPGPEGGRGEAPGGRRLGPKDPGPRGLGGRGLAKTPRPLVGV